MNANKLTEQAEALVEVSKAADAVPTKAYTAPVLTKMNLSETELLVGPGADGLLLS